MSLWVLGLNHQTAPVELRERVSFAGEALPAALASLRAHPQVEEAVLLSTCNRTELYAVTDDPSSLNHWLNEQAGNLDGHLYQLGQDEAVRHLFRVATGLDSMVLGEPQILGQVKDAWGAARSCQTLGNQLDQLFQHSFSVAKRARTDTRIGTNPVSVASIAVRLAQESFLRLDGATVLLVGAGQTMELVAKHLSEANVRRLLVANRTLPRAQALAQAHGGMALDLDAMPRQLAQADIVFTATASPTPVIDAGMLTAALKARRHKPMLLFDLAVPRDIAADVAGLEDAYLYTVDDLEQAVAENRASRLQAADAAQAIIDVQVDRFLQEQQAASRQAIVRELRHFADHTRQSLLARAQQQLAAGKPAEQVLEQFANSLTKQLLHPPTMALRQAALSNDDSLLDAAARLFPLPSPAKTDTPRADDSDPAP
ncbi:glutamyl-tRNA reductase [Stenotrophomonas koreensis]|uniref:glutamyl-tRNA reductase n=1 Tax=Stenotrophomonas koreensis TaxID=266128 RepID=UPI00339A3D4A